MKKIALILSLGLVVLLIAQRWEFAPCETAKKFRIDTVDTRFAVDKDRFIQNSIQAADVWNQAHGKQLLVFDPDGEISVNLVYDERQRQNLQIVERETALTKEQRQIDSQVTQFNQDVTLLQARLKSLTEQINEWNSKGGAPPDIYTQLRQEQTDISIEAKRLEQVAKNLNLSANNFNSQVSTLNNSIDAFNDSLEVRPEEGTYSAKEKKIEIYFYITEIDAIHTLAHEFGHALGISEHNDDQTSVMYLKTNSAVKLSTADQDALLQACAKYTLFDLIRTNLVIASHRLNLSRSE